MWLCGLSLIFAALGGASEGIDFADAARRPAWTHHAVCGEASFDAFQRLPGNPLHRGSPPYEWPVNGFFFEDPPTGDWFVYVGRYAKNYAMGDGQRMDCVVYRSKDRGQSWTDLGKIFPEAPFQFDADTAPVGHAPDVSVVYADGRYHMIYDWASENTDWATVVHPTAKADNGIGYAWSNTPEGPFTRTTPAVYRTGQAPLLLGKYRRGYAASLVKREKDWLVLFMMDSGPNFSWALFGMTADKPEGPYSEPAALRCVDGDYYHPVLMEFFPAFQQDGWVYAPATSVAMNRNFQTLFRARLADALRPEAWEIALEGSVWHAASAPNEYYGIWGQTFSGFVDKAGQFQVMFPSRDPEGMGTINLASRPWNQPYRERGFVISGHQGSSLSLIQHTYGAFSLDAELQVQGEAAILWGYTAPLGPDKAAADATLHPLMHTRRHALAFTDREWCITQTGASGGEAVLARGILDEPVRHVGLSVGAAGAVRLAVNKAACWEGVLEAKPGSVGVYTAAHSRLEATRFTLTGEPGPGETAYLFSDAILGAGAADNAWKLLDGDQFRYGQGAESIRPGVRAKWNVSGAAFTLWAPTGPDYGRAEVTVDGGPAVMLNFSAASLQPSHAMWRSASLSPGPHAIVLVVREGAVPLDSLVVETP